MAADDLKGIEIRSGVNEAGHGFLTVVVEAEGGRFLLGQIDPATTRETAMNWLAAAEAAEQEAAMLRVIRKLDLPDQIAGMVIAELRETRPQ